MSKPLTPESDPVLAELDRQMTEIDERSKVLVSERDQAHQEWLRLVREKTDVMSDEFARIVAEVTAGKSLSPILEQENPYRSINEQISAADALWREKQAAIEVEKQRLDEVMVTLRQHVIDTYGEEYLPPAHRRP